MIEVRNIEKTFGRVRAVRGVSFGVPRGQVAGLLGANGAGKTTTIRMITGFLPADRGSVSVDGCDTLEDSLKARRKIGYLPESAPAYAEMSAEGYLAYRARLFGLSRRERRVAVDRVIERCRLEPVRRRRVGHLSKGFRQRVGLASAMLHDPPVLVLDEPTNGLDPAQIREARTLIRELAQDRTVLVSSHILPEIERTCDRVIIMAAGRVRADGRTADLLSRNRGRYYVEIRLPGQDDGASRKRAMELIRSIRGVEEADTAPGATDNGWARLSVRAGSGAGDLREPIARAAGDAGAVIRELRAEAGGLESVFLEIMESEETPGGGENRIDAGEGVRR